jgi:hypothetical protein
MSLPKTIIREIGEKNRQPEPPDDGGGWDWRVAAMLTVALAIWTVLAIWRRWGV